MTGENPHFGLYHGESILPPSEKRESITVEELQKYPLRYKLYCQEGDETEPVDGLSPEVIARRLQMLNNLDRYITTQGRPGRGRVLREKQLAVFRDTRDFLETGETEGYVEAPTGFGKTVLFSEIIRATNQRTLIAVPSRILVEQTYQRLRQFNPTLDIGRYYSDKKERDKQVTVTTYQSLVIACGGVRPEDIDLLILDEVHQSLTDTRIDAVGRFTHPIKLGFTATPEYSRDKRVENLLNNQIHAVTLREAVETGLLCSFSVYLAETDVDLSNVSVDKDGDYNDRELEEAINIYSRNKSAVELYRRLNEEHSGLAKAVTYCVSINHAREVARVFNEAGIPAAAIWSDQDKNERYRILEAYRRGEIKVLTNVNVLTEGFDDPQAALCLNLRPTLSKVVAKQRGGRVLRLDPNNPKKHAIIVDYLDRNENKRSTQVTFAQVAEGAQIINPVMIDVGGTDSDGNGHEDTVIVGGRKSFDLEGLHVITNTQEVLNIVSGLEAIQNTRDLENIGDSEFALTHDCFMNTFIGRIDKGPLVEIATGVVLKLRTEHPELFSPRKNGAQIIEVCTDRDLFIQEMVKAGAKLKDQKAQELQETDFRLTTHGIYETFEGSYDKDGRLKIIVDTIISRLKVEHPELFAFRTYATQTIKVCTNRVLFIQEMVKAGAKLKDQEIQELQSTDFPLIIQGAKGFTGAFQGSMKEDKRLKLIADKVTSKLKTEHPELFIFRKSRFHTVEVCTDRNLFIQEMVKAGAKLKDMETQELQPTDFPLTNDIRDIFKGTYMQGNRLRKIADKVALRLKEKYPELFVLRRKKTRSFEVCTDRNLFIQEMVKAGAKLRIQNN